MSYLNNRGYVIQKSAFSKETLDKIRQELTVAPKEVPGYGPQESKSFPVFLEGPTKLYIPKAYGLSKFGPVEINKIPPGLDIKLEFQGSLRPTQQIPVNAVIRDCQDPLKMGALLCLSCGEGKCLGYNTDILMYDGSITKVQDVRIGDQLMGDDSTPRNVLSLARGRQEMYKVTLENGDSFVANKNHILSVMFNHKKKKIFNISIKDYLKFTPNLKSKLYSVKTANTKFATNADNIDLDAAYEAGKLLFENGELSHCVKTSSRFARMHTMAGIVDYYGGYYRNSNVFKIRLTTSKQQDDVMFIARSLGLVCYKKKYGNSNYRCIIGATKELLLFPWGDDSTYKYRLFKFKVEPIGVGDYYGFEIDGNRLFVLGDFTITHNTVCAINILCQLAKKTLIVVHKDFLLQQWKDRIHQFTGGQARVGLIKAQVMDIEDKDIVMASLQSISMKDYDLGNFESFGCVIYDECHHLSAKVFSKALQKLNFTYSIGLTATPDRKDGLTKVFKWHVGEIAFQTTQKKDRDEVLIKMIEFTPRIEHSKYFEEQYLYNGKPNIAKMINNICECPSRLDLIVQQVELILKEEPARRFLILSERKSHLGMLKKLLHDKGITDCGFFFGGMKEKQLRESEECQFILATMQMTSEGFDKKGLDTLILGSPKSDVIQIVGRILRDKKEDRKHVPLVIDIVDEFSVFLNQAKKRRAYYKKMKFVIDS